MITIRDARIEDGKELLAIYKPYVEKTAITFDYEVPTLEEFTEKIEKILRKYPVPAYFFLPYHHRLPDQKNEEFLHLLTLQLQPNFV